MASKIFTMKFFSLLISSFAIIQMAMAGDPDILTDFIVPPNVTDVDGTFFTFTGLRELYRGGPSTTLQISKATLAEFPALNGQSVSYAVLGYPADATNPPHTHRRATELLFVVLGTLQVGFVETTNKFFNQTLQRGDIFVFLKGLVHFQYNADAHQHAVAIAAFGSANAGNVSIPNTLFTTGNDDVVLAKSFKTNTTTIEALKAGLAPPKP